MQSFGFLGLGTPELVIILVIVVLLFGAKKLPELARSVGTSVKELKDGVSGGQAASTKSDSADERS